MPTSINDAFKTHGLRAEYEGSPAMIVPITTALAEELDQQKIKQGVTAGQMLLSWNDGTKRNGKVINSDARSDVTLLIKRNDGTDKRIDAQDMPKAVLNVVRTRNEAREDAARVAERNEKAQDAYEEAIGRGETPVAPEMEEPEFNDDAFRGLDGLVSCVRTQQLAIKNDTYADISAKADADGFTAKLREMTRDDLTGAEKSKALEARRLKGEIALLNPEHESAAATAMPSAYEGDREAASEMMAALPTDPEGLSAAQRSAMSRNGDIALVNRLFSVATTTPAMAVEKRALSHTGFATFAQELAKHENKEASDKILPRMATVTRDAMEGYDWQGKIYTKDGADILLMRDQYAAFAYAWDAESRVEDLDVNAVLPNLTREDVPTEEELEALRETVDTLRHDNGAEVNFDWDEDFDDEDEPDLG